MFNNTRVWISTLVIGITLLGLSLFTVVPCLFLLANMLSLVMTGVDIWVWTEARQAWAGVGCLLTVSLLWAIGLA